MSRAHTDTGNRDTSTWPLVRSSRQTGSDGSGESGGDASGETASRSTGAAKNPFRGREYKKPSASSCW